MFTRKKLLKEQVRHLQNRVYELEEILCPCEQHDLVMICSEAIPGHSPMELTYIHVYKCRRCKKTIRKFDYE